MPGAWSGTQSAPSRTRSSVLSEPLCIQVFSKVVSAWVSLIYDDPPAFVCKCPFSCARQTPPEPNSSSSRRLSILALQARASLPRTFYAPIKSSISPSLPPLRPPRDSYPARPLPLPPKSFARILRATSDSLGWNSSNHLSKVLPLSWTTCREMGGKVTPILAGGPVVPR
jgi:hypothetical protein